MTLRAQERPVLSAYTIESGSSHIAETYLSPLKYSGWQIALSYERMQAMRFAPEKWVMRLSGRLTFEHTSNIVRNANMQGLDLDIRWGMMRRINFDKKWSILVGGSTGLDLGVLYSARNSNNPIAAKASWTVNASVGAVYNTQLKKTPVCFRYIAEMPLTGIFFSPEYGELYYEIYLGNHSNLVRTAWPGNYFRLDNLLTADFRFGRTILRLGYRCNVASSKASDIITRHISHTAVIGVASEWISLAPMSKTDDVTKAERISAIY